RREHPALRANNPRDRWTGPLPAGSRYGTARGALELDPKPRQPVLDASLNLGISGPLLHGQSSLQPAHPNLLALGQPSRPGPQPPPPDFEGAALVGAPCQSPESPAQTSGMQEVGAERPERAAQPPKRYPEVVQGGRTLSPRQLALGVQPAPQLIGRDAPAGGSGGAREQLPRMSPRHAPKLPGSQRIPVPGPGSLVTFTRPRP